MSADRAPAVDSIASFQHKKETRLSKTDLIETDVLVVGCGPAGLTSALALARSNVRVLAITKHSQLAPTPRAHVTNQRTFEILRDFGLERQALDRSTDYSRMTIVSFARSLVAEEFGRTRFGLPTSQADLDSSPCRLADLPQHLFEPLLFDAALKAGASTRFATELLSFSQDREGVSSVLLDHLTGARFTVRSRYLVGADGGNSRVAQQLGLPFEGPGSFGSSVNIVFECDLREFVEHRPIFLMALVRTSTTEAPPEVSILRCVKPWTTWMLIKGYTAHQEHPRLSDEEAKALIRECLGITSLDPKITSIDAWTQNASYATKYQAGRVFCVGDAVHRHVPSNGLGSNTAVQDAYNLAWKLAFVVAGNAGATLLDSYSEERVPVGKQVVERATESFESNGPIFDAIGELERQTSEHGGDGTDDAAATAHARLALQDSIAAKAYEFHARGVELNQFYRSRAIVSDERAPNDSPLDAQLYYRSTSSPGAHLPHAWVQRAGRDCSTLDLIGKGRFTVLTGEGGTPWSGATAAVSAQLGIEIAAVAIGRNCEVTDLYFEWAQRREIASDGCLLVRPDGHVAWRSMRGIGPDSERALLTAVTDILAIEYGVV